VSDAERRPGSGRYAHWERERRFLMADLPDGLQDPREIADLYLVGTTLRLRRVQRDGSVDLKLTQKVRPDPSDPSAVRITNTYLTEAEFALLAGLGGRLLTKTRWTWPDSPYAIDQFHGDLAGLVLAEVELEEDEVVPDPPGALAEVTADDRFSGGSLASMSSHDLEAALRSIRPPST